MTLVLSVHSRDMIWLVVDRRLSYGKRRQPVDDAIKVVNLETNDGIALLAYAGLGATALGTQPSDWMSAVLRGRGGLTMDQALGVLAGAATRELPKHLIRIPGRAHSILVPAFINNVGPRIYTIDNFIHHGTGKHWYRYTTHQRTAIPGSPPPRIALGGTGGIHLASKGGEWQRSLLSLVSAHDRGKVSDHVVADEFARINHDAHRDVSDGTDLAPLSSGGDGEMRALGPAAATSSTQACNGTRRRPRCQRSPTGWTSRRWSASSGGRLSRIWRSPTSTVSARSRSSTMPRPTACWRSCQMSLTSGCADPAVSQNARSRR